MLHHRAQGISRKTWHGKRCPGRRGFASSRTRQFLRNPCVDASMARSAVCIGTSMKLMMNLSPMSAGSLLLISATLSGYFYCSSLCFMAFSASGKFCVVEVANVAGGFGCGYVDCSVLAQTLCKKRVVLPRAGRLHRDRCAIFWIPIYPLREEGFFVFLALRQKTALSVNLTQRLNLTPGTLAAQFIYWGDTTC